VGTGEAVQKTCCGIVEDVLAVVGGIDQGRMVVHRPQSADELGQHMVGIYNGVVVGIEQCGSVSALACRWWSGLNTAYWAG
jgi:hypothetical protein